VQKD